MYVCIWLKTKGKTTKPTLSNQFFENLKIKGLMSIFWDELNSNLCVVDMLDLLQTFIYSYNIV